MRLGFAAVLLLALTACGGGGEDKKGDEAKNSPTPSGPDEAVAADACTKLARTWAVKARTLDTALLLMVEDRVNEATTAMGAATDEMEIEGCSGQMYESALMGNYEAALAAAKVRVCVINDAETCDAAHNEWRSKGSPLVDKIRSLTGLS